MKQILLFLSSTFKDMQAERDLLLGTVFREVESEATARGIRFSVVDLRWGVTGDTPEIVSRCLDLVDECVPYFVGLLGGYYGWRPGEDIMAGLGLAEHTGASVTELEIMRFLAAREDGAASIPGLFLIARDATFESGGDQLGIEALKARIAASPRCEVREYSKGSPEEIARPVLQFFRDKLDGLSAAPQPHDVSATVVPAMPEALVRSVPEFQLALGAVVPGSVVTVDGADPVARAAYVHHLCMQAAAGRDGFSRVIHVHVGAEGILGGTGLKRLLESRVGSARTETGGSILVAVDGWEALADWRPADDGLDTLASSGVLGFIGDGNARTAWILAGNSRDRTEWPKRCLEWQIRLESPFFADAEAVATYFDQRFRKRLTPAQAGAISGAVVGKQLSLVDQMLLFDRIRRIGVLRPDAGVAQDDFMLAEIRKSLPGPDDMMPDAMMAHVFKDLDASFGDRSDLARAAVAFICASRFGVSWPDLREGCADAGAISARDWALLRGIFGPVLMGSLGRVRFADEASRRMVERALGKACTDAGRKRLRAWIAEHAERAPGFPELLDSGAVLAHDLLWLGPDDGDASAAMGLLDLVTKPRLWLSLDFHDHYLAINLVNDRLPGLVHLAGLSPIRGVVDPWQGIDHLASLVEAFDPDADPALTGHLGRSLRMADINTNGLEGASADLNLALLGTGYACQRAYLLLEAKRRNGSGTRLPGMQQVAWAIDFARAINRHPGSTQAHRMRAWEEVAELLLLHSQLECRSECDLDSVVGRLVSCPECPEAFDGVLAGLQSMERTAAYGPESRCFLAPASEGIAALQAWLGTTRHLFPDRAAA